MIYRNLLRNFPTKVSDGRLTTDGRMAEVREQKLSNMLSSVVHHSSRGKTRVSPTGVPAMLSGKRAPVAGT